jgi:DNA-binding LacI/PurR family transcriptional regulator
MGFSVPEDISVTGFNSDIKDKDPIPVTSMGYSKIDYGKLAFHHLHERILNPELPFRRMAVVPQLLLKGSAGPVKIQKDVEIFQT